MTREEFIKTYPALIKNYRPSTEVLSHIGSIDLLVIIGPSGVGKTSLIHKLGLPYILSDVTRDPRPEEKDGIDYYFRTDYEQMIKDIKAGRFVQTAVSPSGDFYATRASSYPPKGQAVIAVVADVIPIVRKLGFAKTISAFITPPDYDEWMRRLKTHPITEEKLALRLAEAKRSLSFALKDNQTHFILNDDLDAATGQVKQLLKGMPDQLREQRAKKCAQELLDSIN